MCIFLYTLDNIKKIIWDISRKYEILRYLLYAHLK